MIIENKLYKKEKYDSIKKIHTGYLGAYRTVAKIIEKGSKCENITDDILEYECEFYMNERSGDKINISNKILITKGPKEHYLIDGFELVEITKEKTVYSHIIEIIEYFSKFLKSYVVIKKSFS